MKLQRGELDGWVMERVDFNRLPRNGYLFYAGPDCYVCYPRRATAQRNREALARVVELLARGGEDARRIRSMLMTTCVAGTETVSCK